MFVLFHIHVFAFKRFNNSTKGDFQKYLCRKIELVVLCVILCLHFAHFAWIILLQICFFNLFVSVCYFLCALQLSTFFLIFSSFVDLLVIFCTVALLCCELLALLFCRHFLSIPNPRVFNCIAFSVCISADLHFLLEFFFSVLFNGNASVTCYKKDCKKAQFSCFFFFFFLLYSFLPRDCYCIFSEC